MFSILPGRFQPVAWPMEKIVRPFQDKPATLPTPTRVPVTPEPVVEEEEHPARLQWGGGSGTTSSNTAASNGTPVPVPFEDINADGYMNARVEGGTFQESTPGEEYNRPRPENRVPQDSRPGVLSLDEIDRQTVTFKVYNPDDADQWVKVQAVKSIRFRVNSGSPDQGRLSGRIFKMNMRPPPPPPKPTTSSSSA